jgi:ABC-type transport system substrate-binding protein
MALGFSPEKIISPAADLRSEFHTEGFSNLGSYSNAVVDSLLELLSTPLSADERREIYSDIQARVAEDVPMLFVINLPRLAIVGSRLQGMEADFNGPFVSAGRWWIPPAERRGPS